MGGDRQKGGVSIARLENVRGGGEELQNELALKWENCHRQEIRKWRRKGGQGNRSTRGEVAGAARHWGKTAKREAFPKNRAVEGGREKSRACSEEGNHLRGRFCRTSLSGRGRCIAAEDR